MSKSIKDLMNEKLSNLKHLICMNIVNEENENFKKLMEYEADEIITFYNDNIRPYLNFGKQTIIRSFLDHLEIDKENENLNSKLEQYFNFFEDCIKELEKE